MSDEPNANDVLFRQHFPMQAASGAVTLEYAGLTQDRWPPAVILKLVGPEVREETIRFDEYEFGSPERIAAYLTALSRVLGRTGDPAAFAKCKPSELFQTFASKAEAATVEEFEAALVGTDFLGWLVAGEDPPSAAIARFDELCREIFPMKSENELVSLEFVELTLQASSLRIVLRLVVWDRDDATSATSIRDIKEQEVYFGSIHDHEPARMRAILEGMQRVLSQALMSPEIETLMPHDLFRGDVMKLKTAVTADDFAKALSARSRLGKLLGGREIPASTPPLATPEDLAAVCAETFPMRTTDGAATLEFVEATTDGTNLRIALRLTSAGAVKEETCGLMIAGAYDRGRVRALLRGTRTTFADVAAGKLADAQPSDLLVPALLAKKTTTTEAEFAKALRTKARLGRFF